MNRLLANAFADELEKLGALRVGEARMLVGGLLGAAVGAGTGAATGEKGKKKRRAVGGAGLGAAIGVGGGALYHRLRPIVGSIRSRSQALDNQARARFTADGAVRRMPSDMGSLGRKPLFSEGQVTVYRGTGKQRDRLIAEVLPKTRDVAGRQAPVLVHQTNTRATPREFAARARAYAKKYHTNTPGGRREF